jgi:acetyltransferase-like isoleucine patch superfamily enzyme
MINRPSCYSCKFKGYPRIADITLADFWDEKKVAKDLDDNIGTSAVIINSQKGLSIFEKVSKRLKTQEINIKDIEPFNLALLHSAKIPNYNREEFFQDLDSMRFDQLGDKYFPPISRSRKFKWLKNIARIAYNFMNCTKFRLRPMFQFFKLNFFHPAIHTDWKKNALIYPTPNCVFEIHRKANVEINGMVRIGLKRFKHSKLETRILFEEGCYVRFNGDFRMGYGADVEVFKNAELICGANSGGNIGLTLICGEKIHIGAHTFYGRDVSIRDTNGGHIIAIQGFKNTNPIIIGDFCWLCSECKIMTGVKIGDGTVIGSNSVVITPQPARVIVSGFPAKVVEKNISWKH